MINMERMTVIKQLYEKESWSISKLSKEFGHSRNTIKKYIKESEPKYKRNTPKKSPLRDKIEPHIKTWYAEDMEGPRKQRRTAQKMTQDLQDIYGYTGSYSTVKNILRKIRGINREVFIPRSQNPGEYLEFDFGELKVEIDGVLIKVYLHAYQLCYSNDIFGYLSLRATQEEMFESHKRAFKYFEGVAKKIRYDNLSLAVKKVLKGRDRDETRSFKIFRDQFNFEAHFCAVARGQEKGDVEGCVGYIRRNTLSPVPKIAKDDQLEKLNMMILQWCKGQRKTRVIHTTQMKVEEGYLIEKEALSILPSSTIEVGKRTIGKASHYSLVPVDCGFYSVPVKYAYLECDVLITAREVIISYKTERIARHKRTWEKGKQVFEPLHYLELFKKKPYALLNSKPISQLPKCFYTFFDKAYHKGYGTVKDCISVLELLKTHTIKDVSFAIELACSYNTFYAEGVKTILNQLIKSEPEIKRIKTLKRPELEELKIPPVNLNKYQSLVTKGAQQ